MASDAAERGQGLAATAAQAGAAKMNEKSQMIKDEVDLFVKKQVLKMCTKVVDKLPGMAKTAIEDPDMPRCVSRGKDKAVNVLWPDIRAEVMNEVIVMLDGTPEEVANEDRKGPDCIRAFLRYHLFPYNRSFWGQLRDPVWLIFKLVSLIPLQGVTPLVFFFVFLIIDKRDEFQLVSFVLGFKGTMFLSQGVIRSITGFFTYLNCASMPALRATEVPENGLVYAGPTCHENGPGMAGDVMLPLAGFAFQVLLVWLAFILLPWSEEKGAAVVGKLADVRDSENGGTKKKGGYLIWFLWYDLCCVVLCLGMMGAVLATRPSDEMLEWPVMHALFAVQVIYGYLSMPFFIFTLPLVKTVLTHSVPTAYDRKGCCRKPIKKEAVSVKAQKEEKEQAQQDDKAMDSDTQELVDRIKGLLGMPGGKKAPSP